MRRLVCVAAALAACAFAQEQLPTGRVVERVVCAGNEQQSYALYLPPRYTADRPWPILYCLDPAARGRVPVERFAEAAGRAGWIVAGSNNSRNGPVDIAREAIRWMLDDTHQRFRIDDARMYTAGFSGGARLALAWAASGRIAGAIACGAGFSGPVPKDVAFRVYATAGVDDFNFDEVYGMSRALSQRSVPQRFAEFAGGHDWLPEPLTARALDFLSGRLAPEAPPSPSILQKRTTERFAAVMEQVHRGDDHARRSLFAAMRRDADRAEDGVERRVARRVLLGTFVEAREQGDALLAAQEYAEAAEMWELAVLVRPDNAGAWYGLAAAAAGAHDKRRALDALDRAIANGFRDRERVERDPRFDWLRREPRYAAAISALSR